MKLSLPEEVPSNKRGIWFLLFLILVLGIFFLGPKIKDINFLKNFAVKAETKPRWEVFGFVPHWNLSKIKNIDWTTLTTLAYFSLTVNSDGTIDKNSYEWTAFEGERLSRLFETAQENKVRRVITLTQMEREPVLEFLANSGAWETLANETIQILKEKNLDGVNIDIEYVGENDEMRSNFSAFVEYFCRRLKNELNNPYITVSVLASSVKENKIYDIAALSKAVDGIFMMAYDFYYPGSETIGPSAPLGGYNGGKGPYWYDVKTAVDDFLTQAEPGKVILGVPYYGWVYPAYEPQPKTERISWKDSGVATPEKIEKNKLLETTPLGGWDSQAEVSWRGYWDEDGWHVVYVEDKNSLAKKYEFAKQKNLAGVGIWALGYDGGDEQFWELLSESFKGERVLSRR